MGAEAGGVEGETSTCSEAKGVVTDGAMLGDEDPLSAGHLSYREDLLQGDGTFGQLRTIPLVLEI